MRRWRIASILAAIALAAPAAAQELPKTHFKVIGGWSNINYTTMVEQPFWAKGIPEASKGRITADFTSLDTLGLKGTETLRLLKLGVTDFAGGPISFVAGDFKLYDGLDLAGVLLDIDVMQKAAEAYKPVMDKNMREQFGARLLAVWPSPPQVLFCRDKVGSLADLKGKKIRSFNQTISDFVEGIGATAVNLSFPEVVPALQRGTVDCGVTGTAPGNNAKWWEVTTHLYPLVIGWAPYFHSVNLAVWNRLDKSTQDFMTAQFAKLEADMWAHARKVSQDGINCSVGQGECLYGTKASMTLVPVADADKATLKKLSSDLIVPAWAKRCGKPCVDDWNATVGKVVGITAAAQ
jgi:TRAP-type transport system periplasmic protein